MKTLNDIEPLLKHLGSSAKNATNWIDRLDHLRTSMLPTNSGRSRLFPSIKAKQLMLVAALVRSGARPATADAFAASIVTDIEQGIEPDEFWLVQSGDFESADPMTSGELASYRKLFPALPVTIIPVRAITKLVDDLYEGD